VALRAKQQPRRKTKNGKRLFEQTNTLPWKQGTMFYEQKSLNSVFLTSHCRDSCELFNLAITIKDYDRFVKKNPVSQKIYSFIPNTNCD
jgi:hypothetical protein